jgi:hypothetical protein
MGTSLPTRFAPLLAVLLGFGGVVHAGAASAEASGVADVALLVAERDFFRDQAKELKLRLEAVGVDLSPGNGSGLENKLFRAVSDLRLLSADNGDLKSALLQLFEAASFYRSVSTASNPTASAAFEGALRSASSSLGLSKTAETSAPAVLPSLISAQVVSINESLSCAVINVGASHGVVRGMPFRVVRNGESVCEIRVQDVRERLSAALIEVNRDQRFVARAGDSVAFLAQ